MQIEDTQILFMRCPTLKELPAPPSQDKTGWPWTEESTQLPNTMPDGSLWPRISIVTPSLNQGQFIEETIRSVLLQGYPNLEYIIIDGGSTDGSVEIIKKYEKWLTYWVSEPDNGQSQAINKGLFIATGIMVNWLNSDDYYLPNALERIAKKYRISSGNEIIAGDVFLFDDKTKKIERSEQTIINITDLIEIWSENRKSLNQPGIFFTKDLLLKVGYLNEKLHYSMDFELLSRLLKYNKVSLVNEILAVSRDHENAKTYSMKVALLETIQVVMKHNNFNSHPIYKTELSKFILRRSKYYLMRGEIECSFKYLILSLRNGLWHTIISLISVVKHKVSNIIIS